MKIDSYSLTGFGFILILIGILSMILSFASFYFEYSVTVSDTLSIIGIPSLIVGVVLYAIAEEYIEL